MKINGLIKKSSAVHLAKAASLMTKIRELEQMEDGSYTAFVDDGKDSYDVKICLDDKKDVIGTSCDCGDQNIPCTHIIAVVQTITNPKSKADVKAKKEKKIKPVKLTEVQAFTEHLDKEKVLQWLYSFLEKDKRIFTIFKSHFDKNTDQLNRSSIEEFMKSAITAVINRRKSVQVNEVAAILDIWKPYLDKIIGYISEKVYTSENIDSLLAIEGQILYLDSILAKSTTRVSTFYTKFLEQISHQVFQLKDENKSKFFINYMKELTKTRRVSAKSFFYYTLNSVESHEKKIIKVILNQLNGFVSLGLHGASQPVWTNFIDLLKKADLMKESLPSFLPEQYNNEYNFTIINAAIDFENFKLAKKWCFDCIQTNYYEEYNFPYYNLAEKIIEVSNDKDLEQDIRTSLSKLRTNYKDFLFFINHAKSEVEIEKVIESYSKNFIKSQIYRSEIIKIKMKTLLIKGSHESAINKIENQDSLLGSTELWDDLYKLDNEMLLKKIIKVLNQESFFYLVSEKYKPVLSWLVERYEEKEIYQYLSQNKHQIIIKTLESDKNSNI